MVQVFLRREGAAIDREQLTKRFRDMYDGGLSNPDNPRDVSREGEVAARVIGICAYCPNLMRSPHVPSYMTTTLSTAYCQGNDEPVVLNAEFAECPLEKIAKKSVQLDDAADDAVCIVLNDYGVK